MFVVTVHVKGVYCPLVGYGCSNRLQTDMQLHITASHFCKNVIYPGLVALHDGKTPH